MNQIETDYIKAMQQTDAAINTYYNKRINLNKSKLNLIQEFIKRIKKT